MSKALIYRGREVLQKPRRGINLPGPSAPVMVEAKKANKVMERTNKHKNSRRVAYGTTAIVLLIVVGNHGDAASAGQ